jgi:predicted anti-sigma-YlaC factor YlaD
VGLRLALASGFTQYAYGWADQRAQCVKYEDYAAFQNFTAMARKRYLRAWRWGMEGLELRAPGVAQRLEQDPTQAANEFVAEDVPLLYWTGAPWLAAISSAADRPELIVQLPQPIALLERALVLNPDYDAGGLHEIFVALDMARGEGAGGGEAKALAHYQKALELSKGMKASVFLGYATSVAVRRQDRAGFLEALDKALAVELNAAPQWHLANLLAQERARYLKAHVDDLFDESMEP